MTSSYKFLLHGNTLFDINQYKKLLAYDINYTDFKQLHICPQLLILRITFHVHLRHLKMSQCSDIFGLVLKQLIV